MSGDCLCGQMGRFLMFALLGGGCVCAYYAADSCEFFSFQSQDATRLPGVFFNVTEAAVGLFGYYDLQDECTRYEHNFMQAQNEEEFNAYWVTAQFAAVIAPSCAAMAWLLNIVEWLWWSGTVTYVLTCALIMIAFSLQGLTFMIYGQREFCFDDTISLDCKMEFGAIMSIAATGAFYIASIVWCCMPRTPPFCIAVGNKNTQSNAEKSQDYNDFYGANTFETTATQERPAYELENSKDYYSPSGEEGGAAWADSDNRPPIPNEPQYAASNSYTSAPPPPTDFGAPMGSTTQEAPVGAWQDHTQEWTGHDVSNPMNATHDEPFANPFVLEDAGTTTPMDRPAYGNLQG